MGDHHLMYQEDALWAPKPLQSSRKTHHTVLLEDSIRYGPGPILGKRPDVTESLEEPLTKSKHIDFNTGVLRIHAGYQRLLQKGLSIINTQSNTLNQCISTLKHLTNQKVNARKKTRNDITNTMQIESKEIENIPHHIHSRPSGDRINSGRVIINATNINISSQPVSSMDKNSHIHKVPNLETGEKLKPMEIEKKTTPKREDLLNKEDLRHQLEQRKIPHSEEDNISIRSEQLIMSDSHKENNDEELIELILNLTLKKYA